MRAEKHFIQPCSDLMARRSTCAGQHGHFLGSRRHFPRTPPWPSRHLLHQNVTCKSSQGGKTEHRRSPHNSVLG